MRNDQPAPDARLAILQFCYWNAVTSSRIFRVVLWMTGTLLSFSVLALSIRGLAASLTILEILTVRTCG